MHDVFVLKDEEDGLLARNAQPALREQRRYCKVTIHLESLCLCLSDETEGKNQGIRHGNIYPAIPTGCQKLPEQQ